MNLAVTDRALIVAVVVFAILAVALHDSVAGLGDMATGISETGASVQSSGRATAGELRSSADRVAATLDRLPLVGGEAARAIRDTAGRTAAAVERQSRIDGGRLVAAGRQGQQDARSTARLVGWLAFLIPVALLAAVRFGHRPAAS